MNIDIKPIQLFADEPKKRKLHNPKNDKPPQKKRKIEIANSQISKGNSDKTANDVNAKTNSGQILIETDANSENQMVPAKADSDQGSSVNVVAKIEFRVGEIVWARIKGFPHWPAQVRSFPSAKMVDVFWLNDYRKTRIYRTQMWKFLINFDEFSKRFNDTVGLEAAAKEGLILYGDHIAANMKF